MEIQFKCQWYTASSAGERYALATGCSLAALPAAAQTATDTLDSATALPGKPPGYSPYWFEWRGTIRIFDE